MKNFKNLLGICSCAFLLGACSSVETYKDADAPIDKRVEDLLGRMTLEEKAAQLDMLSATDIIVGDQGLNDEKLKEYIDDMCIGTIHDFYPKTAEVANAIQKRALENSRLGIPLLFIEEGLHGYQGSGGTTFPIQIANSCTWDTTLINQMGKVIGTEARIHGVHFILGPVLDVAHEQRWGRVEETLGEDPYLISRMAVNLINGMQRNNQLDHKFAIASEPKHFGVHGIPDGGKNACTVNIGEREARSTHLYGFEKAVTEAHANGIMAAYHDIDGVPCVANQKLLTDILRNEWGFNGIVVSDLGAVKEQVDRHFTAKDAKEAITNSLNAGLNVQFYDFPHDKYQSSIVAAVKDGTLDEKVLDQRVGDLLRLKFRFGLFENPYVDNESIKELHHCQKHQDIALQASHESLVLLKNENILPFKKDPKHITLVGDLSNKSLLGGYAPANSNGITVLEALRNRFGKDVKIDLFDMGVTRVFHAVPNSVLFDGKGNNGLYTEYFSNEELKGEPVFTTTSRIVSEDWHNHSPAPGIDSDHFSIRYEGTLVAPFTGTYEFKLKSDDLAKLYLNNKVVIDQWSNDKKLPDVAQVHLTMGQPVPFKVEYVEQQGLAAIFLDWRAVELSAEEALYDRITQSAAASDLSIVVVGEETREVGEGKDRQNLNMKDRELKMMEAVEKAGKPAATVIMHGRPFVMTPIEEHSKAILDAWYPGEFGGRAIVDVLFGDFAPTGRLCISVPRSQGQLPIHYLQKRSSHRDYVDGTSQPLYPFGYGLSYTTFEYSDLKVSSKELSKDDCLTVSFKLKNTGDKAGVEVCQLYIADLISSVSLPEKTLKGFSRVELKAGEEKTVEITLKPEHFSLVNRQMKHVIEPGEFEILVGSSSRDIKLKENVEIK